MNFFRSMFEFCTIEVVHWSAYFGKQSLLVWLNYFDADLNLQDRDGMTPLHRAAAAGYFFYVCDTVILCQCFCAE